LGPKRNLIGNLLACNGTYVALLDGDDYWVEPRKLQLQADLLDAHRHYSACFTSAHTIADEHPEYVGFMPRRDSKQRVYLTEDILDQNHMATSSIMYRNFMREIDFGPFMDLIQTDWPLQVLASLRGPIAFLPELTTVYRIHNGGIWTGLDEAAKREAKYAARKAIADLLPERYVRQATAATAQFCQRMAQALLDEKSPAGARVWIWRSLSALRLRDAFQQRSHLMRSMLLLAAMLRADNSAVERSSQ
jgi:hypothetical protein